MSQLQPYHDLTAEPREVGAGDSVLVTLRLRNEGIRRATEVVQLYLRDEVAAVARPVLALAGVARVPLAVGEEREVRLWLAPDAFTFLDQQLQRRREPGRFVAAAASIGPALPKACVASV